MQVVLDEIIEKSLSLTSRERSELIHHLQKQEKKVESNGKKNPSPNIEWLKAHRNEVAGKYVALQDGKLIAEGRTLREVDQEAKRKGANKPLLTYVAREDEGLWAGW
ncbi:hypothetical protein BH20ACI1_BH20ACI1_13930 [soil metagenome]